jgi:hypothetical protein
MILLKYLLNTVNRNLNLLPLLPLLEKYPFPKPSLLTKTSSRNPTHHSIASFRDALIVKNVATAQIKRRSYSLLLDNASESHLNIGVMNSLGEKISLLFQRERHFLTETQIKAFFKELVQMNASWSFAAYDTIEESVYEKYFTETQLRSRARLTWLQYWSPALVIECGGFAALESNPYVQTERVHEGLLLQVGDNPTLFNTPEGEVLLIKAMNALPLIKHRG